MKEIGMPGNRDIVKEAQMIIDSFAVIATSAAMFLAIFLKIY